MSTYIYGVAESSHPALPDGMNGVGDPPRTVRLIEADGLAAVVSDSPEGLSPRCSDLLAHRNVLHRVETAGPVLPMRFGSQAADDTSVKAVLAARGAHLRERLQAVTGKVEYNVKAGHREQAVLRRVLAENPELRSMTEANRHGGGGGYHERLRLEEVIAGRVRECEETDALEVRHRLEPVAAAVSAGPGATGLLANLSFLVDRRSADTFLTAVERIGEDLPYLELSVNGPLPPYSFVDPAPAKPAERSRW